MKTLACFASREVYFLCYKIIKHFINSSYYYCLCDRYQGCERGPFPFNEKGYCCVCRTGKHYSLDKLNDIKYDSFELEKFYLNILRDLEEILSVDPTACSWNNELYYRSKNWQERKEGQTCLRNVIYILLNL